MVYTRFVHNVYCTIFVSDRVCVMLYTNARARNTRLETIKSANLNLVGGGRLNQLNCAMQVDPIVIKRPDSICV